MTNQPKVLILYICYGTIKYLPDVVSAIAKLDYPKDRLAVMFVPNGSPDGITEAIKKDVLPRSQKDLPECILVDDGINRGFAGGNNHGMRYAIEHGFDYIFLNNGDLTMNPHAISELVKVADADEKIGSAQSLVFYWNDHGKINVSGGVIHVAGYGYARDNLARIEDRTFEDGEEIAYSTGAAVLYRTSALKKVGFLEEGFFMYHEDLELGMRLRIAGYKNVLAPKSWAYHDYSFSRNPKKFAWMELYRWVVVLAYYKIATLILLSPLLFAIEIGTWCMAIKGGWIQAKLWALQEWFKPRTWKLIFMMRARAKKLRVITDRELLKDVVGAIHAQEQHNKIMDTIANPVVTFIWRVQKMLIRW